MDQLSQKVDNLYDSGNFFIKIGDLYLFSFHCLKLQLV